MIKFKKIKFKKFNSVLNNFNIILYFFNFQIQRNKPSDFESKTVFITFYSDFCACILALRGILELLFQTIEMNFFKSETIFE